MGDTRQLAIKTGAVKRMRKDLAMYAQELRDNSDRLAQLESSADADEYAIKQARRVKEESERILPDAEERLGKALRELEELVERSETGDGSVELEQARRALSEQPSNGS